MEFMYFYSGLSQSVDVSGQTRFWTHARLCECLEVSSAFSGDLSGLESSYQSQRRFAL